MIFEKRRDNEGEEEVSNSRRRRCSNCHHIRLKKAKAKVKN
jgi:hypothetical protein